MANHIVAVRVAWLLVGPWIHGGRVTELFFEASIESRPWPDTNSAVGSQALFFLDQIDSVVGALFAVSLCVPVPMITWVVLLVSGTVVHWLFNVVLFLVGAKKRAA